MIRYGLAACVVGLFVVIAPTVKAQPSMVGDTVLMYSTPQLTGVELFKDAFVVVDPGVEHTSELSLFSLDFDESTITLTSLNDWHSPYFDSGFAPSSMSLRDIEIPGSPGLRIGAINVLYPREIVRHDDTPEPWPDFSAANFSFGDHEVMLSYGGYEFPQGSQVVISLTFVPEPSSVVLVGLGCMAVGAWIRLRGRRGLPA
jgi:hypothetical protein